MKKIFLYLISFIIFSVIWTGCEKDKFDDTIYKITEPNRDSVGEWIYQNLTIPYNIHVTYRWEDGETDMSMNLIPPKMDTVVPFLRTIMHGWLKPYMDLCGKGEINQILPKHILLLGSSGYNRDGTEVLGTAEAGKKIVLYKLETFNPKDRANVKQYLRIIHHEFSHIFHQLKLYNTAFRKITPKSYTAGWFNVGDAAALNLGFVSPYAMQEPDEDFVETIAEYVTSTPEEWEKMMSGITSSAGKLAIQRKLDMVRTYLDASWQIDIEKLRIYVNVALDEIVSGKY